MHVDKIEDPTISPPPKVLPITKKIHMGSSTNSLTEITRFGTSSPSVRKGPVSTRKPSKEDLQYQAAFEDQHQPLPAKSESAKK